MKKLTTLLTLLLLSFASTTYLYYSHWRSQQQRTADTPYILPSAALTYEVIDFNKQWKYFRQTSIGQALSILPPFTAIHQAMTWVQQELLTASPKLAKVPLILSLHGSPQGQVNCLLYFNTHDIATQTFLTAAMSKVQKSADYHVTTKKHARRKITIWHKKDTTQQLALMKHKQHMIASFSPALIEELADSLSSSYSTRLVSLHRSENAYGSVYVNLKRLPRLFHTIVKPDQMKPLSSALATLAQDSLLNLKLMPHHLLLSGTVAVPPSSPQYLINTTAGQTAGPITLADYLPQRTTALKHITFSHADQLLEAWQQYRKPPRAPVKDADHLLTATLLPLLQGEIAHCTLPAHQSHPPSQLVFMKVTDPQAFIKVLRSAKALTPTGALQTYHVKSDCFREGLLGLLFPSFTASYLRQVKDYVLLANHQAAFKTWHTQYQQGKTWAENPTRLASTLDQAHFTWLADLQQLWPTLIKSLQPHWQKILKSYTTPPIDASLQLLRNSTNGFYLNILLKYKEDAQPQMYQEQSGRTVPCVKKALSGKVFFQTEAPLAHAPWLVKSHRGKGCYVLLQDINHQVYLVDPTGKLLWKKALEGPIATQVFEIDFYKNNKLQYLLATNYKLHLIDYYGRKVGPYPQSLPAPAQLQVVDYNRDKKYRFLLATAQGDIYLKDKQYKSLPGWSPRVLGHSFASVPFYGRLQGRDYFLALQTNGILHMLSRRGKSYSGFPLSLKEQIHNPLIAHKTATGAVLTTVTDEGKQIDVNLAGQLQQITQLDRTANTTRFILCPNQALGDGYAVVRQDENKVVVMDATRKPLFEVPYNKKKLIIQYYCFEKGKQIYALTSPEEQLTYFYNATGKQLATLPWKNGDEVRIIFSKKKHQLEIYGSVGTQCVRYVLKY